MSDLDTLTVLVRLFGLLTALLGTAAAVPAAVWRWHDRTVVLVKRLLRRPAEVRAGTVEMHLGVNWAGVATGRAPPVNPDLATRVTQLEQRIDEQERTTEAISASLQAEIQTRTQAETRLAGEIESLKTGIHELQQINTEVDANALPVVAVGIVLTTISDWIGQDAWWAVFWIVIGVVCSQLAVALLVSHGPDDEQM